MAENISHCPNCGTEWPTGAEVCPHCGYHHQELASWPPTPTGFSPPQPTKPILLTGQVWGDLTLGVGITLASYFANCLGLVIMPILYFVLRAKYPVLTRGIGYGLLAGVVILLGALAWCYSGRQHW